MPRCELCGVDETNLTSVAVSHAELDVCTSCADLGTPLEGDEDDADEPNTKYSTGSSAGTSPQDIGDAEPRGGARGPESVASLAPDYADRVRAGREQAQLTIDELADQVNEKASYIQNIEQGSMTPDTTVQMQLEQFLNIDLTIDEEP